MNDAAYARRYLQMSGGLGLLVFGTAFIASQVASGWSEAFLGGLTILSLALLGVGSVIR